MIALALQTAWMPSLQLLIVGDTIYRVRQKKFSKTRSLFAEKLSINPYPDAYWHETLTYDFYA